MTLSILFAASLMLLGTTAWAAEQRVLLTPTPKSAHWTGDHWRPAQRLDVVVGPGVLGGRADVAGIVEEELQSLRRTVRVHEHGAAGAPRLGGAELVIEILGGGAMGEKLGIPALEGEAAASAEAYRLDISQERVVLQASDQRGVVCGLISLGQLARQGAVPTGRVVDYPSLDVRWTHLQIPTLSTGGDDVFNTRFRPGSRFSESHASVEGYLPTLERMIDDALAQKLNGVVIDVNNAFRLRSHPELAIPEAVDVAALRPLIQRIHRYGATAVPLVHLFSHQEQLLAPAYPELMLVGLKRYPKKHGARPGEFFWWNPLSDPRRAEVKAIHEDVLDEIIELFDASWVHVGHDEAGSLAFVHRDEESEIVDLFVESLTHAHAVVTARGARMMMWGDMLLNQRRIAGAAHGGAPKVPTHQAVATLPKDIVVVDWQYYPVPKPYPEANHPTRADVPSSLFLTAQGFDVIGASLARPADGPELLPTTRPVARQQRRFAAYLDTLEGTEGGGRGLGLLACHFYLGPHKLRDWMDTDRIGSMVLAAEASWNAGVRLAPEPMLIEASPAGR